MIGKKLIKHFQSAGPTHAGEEKRVICAHCGSDVIGWEIECPGCKNNEYHTVLTASKKNTIKANLGHVTKKADGSVGFDTDEKWKSFLQGKMFLRCADPKCQKQFFTDLNALNFLCAKCETDPRKSSKGLRFFYFEKVKV